MYQARNLHQNVVKTLNISKQLPSSTESNSSYCSSATHWDRFHLANRAEDEIKQLRTVDQHKVSTIFYNLSAHSSTFTCLSHHFRVIEIALQCIPTASSDSRSSCDSSQRQLHLSPHLLPHNSKCRCHCHWAPSQGNSHPVELLGMPCLCCNTWRPIRPPPKQSL